MQENKQGYDKYKSSKCGFDNLPPWFVSHEHSDHLPIYLLHLHFSSCTFIPTSFSSLLVTDRVPGTRYKRALARTIISTFCFTESKFVLPNGS